MHSPAELSLAMEEVQEHEQNSRATDHSVSEDHCHIIQWYQQGIRDIFLFDGGDFLFSYG
jgi:hypothetical protein